MARPNVVGCFIGRKRKGGADTGRLAVVCCVVEKLRGRGRLLAAERVPPKVEWKPLTRRTVSLPTDVEPVGPSGFHALAGPGDLTELPGTGGGVATVGVALRHPAFGDVVTTAGHAFLSTPGTIIPAPGHEPTLRVRNMRAGAANDVFDARLLKAVLSDEVDYALLRPVGAVPCRNAYQDELPLAGAYLPSAADIPLPLLALTAAGIRATTLRGVEAVLPVGNVVMKGLLLTDWVTDDGDSGCALIDGQSRLVGVLTGFGFLGDRKFSLWTSVFWPMLREQATLA